MTINQKYKSSKEFKITKPVCASMMYSPSRRSKLTGGEQRGDLQCAPRAVRSDRCYSPPTKHVLSACSRTTFKMHASLRVTQMKFAIFINLRSDVHAYCELLRIGTVILLITATKMSYFPVQRLLLQNTTETHDPCQWQSTRNEILLYLRCCDVVSLRRHTQLNLTPDIMVLTYEHLQRQVCKWHCSFIFIFYIIFFAATSSQSFHRQACVHVYVRIQAHVYAQTVHSSMFSHVIATDAWPPLVHGWSLKQIKY